MNLQLSTLAKMKNKIWAFSFLVIFAAYCSGQNGIIILISRVIIAFKELEIFQICLYHDFCYL